MKKKYIAALVFTVLIFAVAIATRISYDGAFIQLGDVIIMIAACFLPTSLSMLAAAVGCAGAVLVTGSPSLLLYIVVIRVLIACWFVDEDKKILNQRNIVGTIASAFILIIGSLIADMIKYQDIMRPLDYIPINALSAGANIAIFYVISFILDKLHIRNKWMAKEDKK